MSMKFPCALDNDAPGSRSTNPPTSVHQLRPGDIDVVASIGDSLSAATGAISGNLYDTLARDNRGMSWIAGMNNCRASTQLINILYKLDNREPIEYYTIHYSNFIEIYLEF
jgi:hypothetical protein